MNKIEKLSTPVKGWCAAGLLLLQSFIGVGQVFGGDIDGFRSSFLLGNLYTEKLGSTLYYLSSSWSDTERKSIRLRLLTNGDTHIDVYVRASAQSKYAGGSISSDGDYLSYLTELSSAGLQPMIWLTPNQPHSDYKASMTSQKAFMNSVVLAYDSLAAGYVVCLECDEYWTSAQVSELASNLKLSTSKPIGVHLTPGVGGTGGDTTYYDEADYIILQFGDHLTGDFITDIDIAVAMLQKALALGKDVIASEYALYSESAEAKALGDILCAQGALGTGNGRTVNYCGQGSSSDDSDSDSDSSADELSDTLSNAGMGLVAVGAVLYVARLTNAASGIDLTDTGVHLNMNWRIKDDYGFGWAYSEMYGRDGKSDVATGTLGLDYSLGRDQKVKLSYSADINDSRNFQILGSYQLSF
jgi:hypothetical protein